MRVDDIQHVPGHYALTIYCGDQRWWKITSPSLREPLRPSMCEEIVDELNVLHAEKELLADRYRWRDAATSPPPHAASVLCRTAEGEMLFAMLLDRGWCGWCRVEGGELKCDPIKHIVTHWTHIPGMEHGVLTNQPPTQEPPQCQ